MINNKLLLAAGVATLSASFFSTSAFAANVDANAKVIILEPLSIVTGANDLDFGDVAGDADEISSVTLTFGGVATASAYANASGTTTAGDFTVAGAANLLYDITYTDGTLTGPGDAMTVDSFTDSNTGTGTLDAAGDDTFTVGATLNLNAGQAAGSYSGSYNVDIEYQ